MADRDREKLRKDFDEAVNMTALELRKWLATKESRSVGWKSRRSVYSAVERLTGMSLSQHRRRLSTDTQQLPE